MNQLKHCPRKCTRRGFEANEMSELISALFAEDQVRSHLSF